MKKMRTHAARTSHHKHTQAGPVSHAARRASLHRQIKAARTLHHKLILHPLSIIAILAAGVLITGWTLSVAADSYNVTAKVPAPPLTEGAIITNPQDGSVTQTSPLVISGTCPSNSYVKLTRNGSFSGSALCVSNVFSVQTSLSVGANTISAQDYNITDDPGPATAGIIVTYSPPITSPSSPPSGTPSTTSVSQPLLITSDYHFQAFATGAKFSWAIHIGGGTSPYSLRTDWGDKQTSVLSVLAAQDVTIEHTYARPGYYPIIIYLTDAKSGTTSLQLAALIKLPGTPGLVGTTPDGTSNNTSLPSLIGSVIGSKGWLLLAWPAYTVLVLMAISFWLGERQELFRLMQVSHMRSHRPHHR